MSVNRRGFLALSGIAVAGVVSVTSSFERQVAAQTVVATRVRVVHAATNEGKVKVSINGDKEIEGLDYGQVSDFVEVEPGDVWVEIEQDGLDLFDFIYSGVYPIVPAGFDYQIVLSDEVVAAQIVGTKVLPASKARARMVHASVSAPVVDVIVKETDIVLLSKVRYPFSTDYVEVEAGTFDLQLVQTGTANVVLDLPGSVLEAGIAYDFVAAGTPGDADKPLMAIVASTTTATA